MYSDNDFDEMNRGKSAVIAALCCIAAISLVIAIVVLTNADKIKKKIGEAGTSVTFSTYVRSIPESSYDPENEVHVGDLSFYKTYASKEEDEDVNSTETSASKEEELPDEATDGHHTYVENEDGTGEWVAISPYLLTHDYDFINLINSNGKMKYYVDNKCVSYFGVDISKEQDYIDFVKLKKAGADFVMIRAALRGYSTGTLSVDDYFYDNIKRASDAGLNIGLYFSSQAITEAEAKEEAAYLLGIIEDYSVNYPIAFVQTKVTNDKARTDKLSKNERTKISKAFMNAIKDAGYMPMLYGTKAQLIKQYDLSKIISDYDIWLSQTDCDAPDFPYKFSMWQYNKKGSIDGIAGDVNLNISFIDFSVK